MAQKASGRIKFRVGFWPDPSLEICFKKIDKLELIIYVSIGNSNKFLIMTSIQVIKCKKIKFYKIALTLFKSQKQ